MSIKNQLADMFSEKYQLKAADAGEYSKMSKNGMNFLISAFDARRREGEGSFRVSFIELKAMLGLMAMETAIITSQDRDVPLFSFDLIRAFGKNTLLIEADSTQVGEAPQELLKRGNALKAKYSDLTVYQTEKRWYDAIKYPMSVAVTGKGVKEKVTDIVGDYAGLFLDWMESAPECEESIKTAATKAYVDRLLGEGGTSTDQFNKLFGRERTEGVFRFLFNV